MMVLSLIQVRLEYYVGIRTPYIRKNLHLCMAMIDVRDISM